MSSVEPIPLDRYDTYRHDNLLAVFQVRRDDPKLLLFGPRVRSPDRLKEITIMSDYPLTSRIALANGYSKADLHGGLEYLARKKRRSHPPGTFDNAGRFRSDERSAAVESARSPSRAWPYSEMKAARTAAHCAEQFHATKLHVGRIAKAAAIEAGKPPRSSHEALALCADIGRVLKPVGA